MGTTVFERQPPSPSVIDASLRDTDLRTALFLTDAQLRPATGSTRTQLPVGVKAPKEWALEQP